MRSATYSLAARIVVQHRHLPLQGGYWIGLLTRAPSPEGTHAIECDMPGYQRQPVQFSPLAQFGFAVRSEARASFGEIAGPGAEVTHGAVYNLAGDVIAYGLLERAPGTVGPLEVAFEAGAISVRN